MLVNISKWGKRLHLTVHQVACLANNIDPDFTGVNSPIYVLDANLMIAETEKDLIAFIGSDANKNGYMASRETIYEYYEYIEMTCPDVLKPAKKLNNTIDTSDSNAITKIESELNTKK